MSSETVATAALGTYDIYKAYINPSANSAQLVRVSHMIVIVFGVVVAAISVAFNHAGFSVNYLITSIGIFVDSAIVPMACTIMWRKQSLAAVIISPLCSTLAAAVAWFCTAYTHYGAVTISTTSQPLPLVAGNMMSICGPMVLTPLITYIKPDNFDWEIFKQIKSDVGTLEDLQSRQKLRKQQPDNEEKNDTSVATATATAAEEEEEEEEEAEKAAEEQHDREINARLLVARKKAAICCVLLCLSFCILWPIPMYATDYVFSKPFFRGWIVVVFLWGFFAAITITIYPVWEGRASIARFFRYATGRSAIAATTTTTAATANTSAAPSSSIIEGIVVQQRHSAGGSSHEEGREDVKYETAVPGKIG